MSLFPCSLPGTHVRMLGLDSGLTGCSLVISHNNNYYIIGSRNCGELKGLADKVVAD